MDYLVYYFLKLIFNTITLQLMHKYIPYLLADIKNASRHEDFYSSYKPSIENYFEAVESFLDPNASLKSFSSHCGIDSSDFPPAEQLSEEEMKMVVNELHKMMFTWNISVDLPDDIPADFAYKLSVEVLDRKLAILNHGIVGVDFCTGNPEGCELKDYCPCSKMDSTRFDFDPNMDQGENELPY